MSLESAETRAQLRGLIDRLGDFVRAEQREQRRQLDAIWSKPLAARVAAGRAIEGVRVVSPTPDGGLELACLRNTSRFREGDTVCLNRGDPNFAPRLRVTIARDNETRLIVNATDFGADVLAFLDAGGPWVLDEDMLDLTPTVLGALNQVGDCTIGVQRILPLLLGTLRSNVDQAAYARAFDVADAQGLNESQAEAFAQACATDLAWLVQGPPGTGKTRVLALLAATLAEAGERVLVTGLTHRAINNALNQLARLAPDVACAKIGAQHRTDDLADAIEQSETFAAASLAAEKGGYVIGATPFALRSQRLAGVDFETVIFDEASQLTLPVAIMAMLAGKRYVFFGDQNQLPPVLARSRAKYGDGRSVFAVLADQGLTTMLTETYRLNDALCAWPSATFYDGQLQPATPAIAAQRIEYATPEPRLAEVLDPAHPLVFLDLGHRNATTRSFREAGVVLDVLLALLEAGVPQSEIAVVVPYRAQAREIRSLLRQAVPDDEIRRHIVIDTVERMQGQERDVVIVSLTTSQATFAAQLAEFFFQPERLNVAVTRARSKLIVVGSRHVLEAQPELEEHQESVALWRDFIASCSYRAYDALGLQPTH